MSYGSPPTPPGQGPHDPYGSGPGYPPQPPGGGYPYGYQFPAAPKPVSPLAIVAVVLSGVSSFCCSFASLLALPGFICGVIAFNQARNDPEANPTSKTLAIVAMVVGGVVLLISVVAFIVVWLLPYFIEDPAALAVTL